MKELTIEQKAKRYDEAIKKAKYYYDKGKTPEFANYIVSDIFPEFKENDDERIRKRIIQALHGDVLDMDELSDAITWLKKQGEQKSTDNVEPKFKVGDWVSGYYTNYKIIAINSKGYVVEDIDGNKINILFENEKFHHLWTIQDAKDGDVLRIRNLTFIFQEITNNNACHKDAVVAYCSYEDNNDGFGVCGPDCITDLEIIAPATKEQRDTLKKAMANADYEWNTEKKELKKIK